MIVVNELMFNNRRLTKHAVLAIDYQQMFTRNKLQVERKVCVFQGVQMAKV